MGVKPVSRDVNELVPELQKLFELFSIEMDKAGIPFMVTETRRTQERQDELWAQGRTKSGSIVTWTRKSKHIEGKAFDIAILENGKPTWKESLYFKPGEIGEGVGLRWGINIGGKRHDLPHFELP